MTTFSFFSHFLSSTIPPSPSPSSKNSIFYALFKGNTKQFTFSKATNLLQLQPRITVFSSLKDAGSSDNTPRFAFFVGFCLLILFWQMGWLKCGILALVWAKSTFFYYYFVFGSNFCIIEGPETIEDFVQMQLQEIQDNIKSRRNKIFLLMEEVSL